MKKQTIHIKILTIAIVFTSLTMLLYFATRPVLTTKSNEVITYDITTMNTLTEINDRHCGWVNLQKLIDLASMQGKDNFEPSKHVSRSRDSVTISCHNNRFILGLDDGKSWTQEKYKKLPIRILDKNTFRAKVKKQGSVEYVYIPYVILQNMASAPHAVKDGASQSKKTIINRDSTSTLKSTKDAYTKMGGGNKIQIEGIVFSHVSDILRKNGPKHASKREQLEILWRYAKDNWYYIHDPSSNRDTWRSAEETINNYYFSNTLQYSGDCDDFAILMASFARQLGYESRVATVFGDKGGHAYAEFEDGDHWIPLDWFSNKFGGTPYQGSRKAVFNEYTVL